MSLSYDEVEKMHKDLKDAFDAASRNWNSCKDYYDSQSDKRRSIAELAAAATALLQADERLRELEQTSNVTKLTDRMPGKK
jgi:hypothetical protein